MVLIFSCEKQGIFFLCDDCKTEEPINTTLEIKLHMDFYGNPVLLKIYEGNLEDSVLYRTYTTVVDKTTVTVALNKKYTVTATYYRLGDIYIAVDSATPSVKYDEDQCDNPCYFVYDRLIDLRIKHY